MPYHLQIRSHFGSSRLPQDASPGKYLASHSISAPSMAIVPDTRDRSVLESALWWGMGDQDGHVSHQTLACAEEWYTKVAYQSYFATSIYFPYKLGGITPGNITPGVMLLQSTGESCMIDKANMEEDGRNSIRHPGWWRYHVYWFEGLAMHNVKDMIERHGGILLGTAEEVLDKEWARRHIDGRTWRSRYLPQPGFAHLLPLWSMLHDLQVVTWTLYTTGLSWHAYRGIDVYIRQYAWGMPEPTQEAHWLVNHCDVWWQRPLREPYDWYKCRVWESLGQKDCIYVWNLLNLKRLRSSI